MGNLLYLYAGLIGLAAGMAGGLFGIGGGIIMVPALTLLLKLDIKTAVGTSLCIMIPSALTGALKHLALGHVHAKVALCVIPTAIVGAYLGAQATGWISAEHLRRAFGVLLLAVGVKLILGK
ncbi:MAG: sulfite exporter TauE/SafE family protein [Verrucomicrobia bacterium]|nr:sulfite exporter TauE/SafE family protein [Verrucomicrobiota bacterium]